MIFPAPLSIKRMNEFESYANPGQVLVGIITTILVRIKNSKGGGRPLILIWQVNCSRLWRVSIWYVYLIKVAALQ